MRYEGQTGEAGGVLRDWEWRREANILSGTVSGWLELVQQLQASSVPHSVHTMSSAQQAGTNSTVSIKPVLPEHTTILVNKELSYMKALGKLCAGIWWKL